MGGQPKTSFLLPIPSATIHDGGRRTISKWPAGSIIGGNDKGDQAPRYRSRPPVNAGAAYLSKCNSQMQFQN
jgi:hypothetical protein